MTLRSLKNKRCVGYARYSTIHQRQESIEDQLRICEEYVRAQGGIWVASYSDPECSGQSFMGRPGFAALMADAERGKYEYVVTEDLDRITRQASGLHAVIEELEALDIGIHTVRSGEVTQMAATFSAFQNAEYARNMSLKSRRGVEGTVLKGRQSGRLPYGYRKVPVIRPDGSIENGHREIVEAEAGVILRIYRDFAADLSIRDICRALTKEGVPGPGGRPWRPGVLYGNKHKGTGILRNRLYKGETVWGRTEIKRNRRAGTKKAQVRARHDWTVVAAPDLRIIPDDLFDAVQERLGANETPDFQSKRKAEYLLSGLCRCGACGAKYQVLQVKMGCVGRAERHDCSNRRRVDREEIEGVVVSALASHFLEPRFIQPFVEEYRRELELAQGEWGAKRNELQTRLDGLEKAKQVLTGDLRKGDLQDVVRNVILEELAKVESERAMVARALKAEPAGADLPLDDEAIIARMRAVVADLQANLTSDERDAARARELIRSLIENVTISPIEEENADGRGIGPVRITVVGNLTRALGLADLSRVVQHASRPESMQDHATVLVELEIDLFPSDMRLEQGGYAVLEMMTRMLDDASHPVSRKDFIDGLAELWGEDPDYSERSPQAERVRYAMNYMQKRGLLARYGWKEQAGYLWAAASPPSPEVIRRRRETTVHLPFNTTEVDLVSTISIRAYRRDEGIEAAA
ncbi:MULTISPECIES: recombinase family protein [Brevundimonas]|uniref:Recombinase family protein n=1 Tax=Brevundimonas diminuta TaxID=293 RepID=A0A410NV50_BREDI|nr:recombinase family protein [Brevundimonas diminuta]QAT13762.1 recombinase family protein [Brevundimonas diminuta]QQB88874.1 recombinase family protein [Brevundimonas diminuta]GEC02181.1 hypothetical protein BDI01nite_32450 [Brevundimonas diminuta]